MKRVLFVVAMVSTMAIGSTAFASQPRAARANMGATRQGPIAKLIELERRKNEWLFGRPNPFKAQ
jgi:hypothetical protein